MGKKKEHHEEHVDETWLIPYADMLTLLLALFIVMFAMSKTDQAKFKQVSEQFNIIFSGGTGVMKESGSTSVPLPTPSKSPEGSNVTIEDDKMKEMKKNLEKEVEKNGYGDKVKIDLNKDGLYISIQDVVLFNSGDAQIVKDVVPLLQEINKMLGGLQNNIRIAGHTDNVPIHTEKFSSNWELSAMRATNVMHFMLDSGIHPERISLQAFGEYMPKFDNSTDEGRAKNRRVEVLIIRQYQTNTANTTNTTNPANITTTTK